MYTVQETALSLTNKMATLGLKKSASVAAGFVFMVWMKRLLVVASLDCLRRHGRVLSLVEISTWWKLWGLCRPVVCWGERMRGCHFRAQKNVNKQKKEHLFVWSTVKWPWFMDTDLLTAMTYGGKCSLGSTFISKLILAKLIVKKKKIQAVGMLALD